MEVKEVIEITKRISVNFMGTEFSIRVERDNKRPEDGRIFLQACFNAPCSKSGEIQEWHGRKWYLSDHMTIDEIVKTSYGAFKMAVEHEMMESFKVDGIILFNPHINFEELLKVSSKEIVRD